jgi:hypothetical protein
MTTIIPAAVYRHLFCVTVLIGQDLQFPSPQQFQECALASPRSALGQSPISPQLFDQLAHRPLWDPRKGPCRLASRRRHDGLYRDGIAGCAWCRLGGSSDP